MSIVIPSNAMKPISSVDKFRIEILEREWAVNSFRKNHEHYRTQWMKVLGLQPQSDDLKRLGESLRTVMKSLGGDRSNAGVAAAGSAFECMVSWYLNLLLWGTPIIVGKKHNKLPKVFSDITTVNIDGKKSNSETDLIAFSVPDSEYFVGSSTELNQFLERRIKDVDLTIIQTKTNWNDNSQIPMLWNMIYNVADFRVPNISIGVNGFTPLSLNELRYAFVTLPSQRDDMLGTYKPSSMAVKRVKTLTGGNFWCCPAKDDVVSALHEFPSRNFSPYIAQTSAGNLWGHVQNNLEEIPTLLDSFLNLNFDELA